MAHVHVCAAICYLDLYFAVEAAYVCSRAGRPCNLEPVLLCALWALPAWESGRGMRVGRHCQGMAEPSSTAIPGMTCERGA